MKAFIGASKRKNKLPSPTLRWISTDYVPLVELHLMDIPALNINQPTIASFITTTPSNIFTSLNTIIINRTLYFNKKNIPSVTPTSIEFSRYTKNFNIPNFFSIPNFNKTVNSITFDSPFSSIVLSSPNVSVSGTTNMKITVYGNDISGTYYYGNTAYTVNLCPEIKILDNFQVSQLDILNLNTCRTVSLCSFEPHPNFNLFAFHSPNFTGTTKSNQLTCLEIDIKRPLNLGNDNKDNSIFSPLFYISNCLLLSSFNTSFIKNLSTFFIDIYGCKNFLLNFVDPQNFVNINKLALPAPSDTRFNNEFDDTTAVAKMLSAIDSSQNIRRANTNMNYYYINKQAFPSPTIGAISYGTFADCNGVIIVGPYSFPAAKATSNQIGLTWNYVRGLAAKQSILPLQNLTQKRFFINHPGLGCTFEYKDLKIPSTEIPRFLTKKGNLSFNNTNYNFIPDTNYVSPSAIFMTSFTPISMYTPNNSYYYSTQTGETTNPTLTCVRNSQYEIYYDNPFHRFALRKELTSTSIIPGASGNDSIEGIAKGIIYFTPNTRTPDEIIYCSINNNSLSGTIYIKDTLYEYK